MGGLPFGFGMALLMVSRFIIVTAVAEFSIFQRCQIAITAYLMDTYAALCASAIAAVVVTRSVMAAAFPLFTPRLLRGLGTEWGLSIFGFLSLVCAPLPFLLYVSDHITKTKVAPTRQLSLINHCFFLRNMDPTCEPAPSERSRLPTRLLKSHRRLDQRRNPPFSHMPTTLFWQTLITLRFSLENYNRITTL